MTVDFLRADVALASPHSQAGFAVVADPYCLAVADVSSNDSGSVDAGHSSIMIAAHLAYEVVANWARISHASLEAVDRAVRGGM